MTQSVSIVSRSHERAKIALVVDSRNWAFDNIARQIMSRLSGKYDFTIIYTSDFKGDYELIFNTIYGQPFDLVHYFWRETILNVYMHILRTCESKSDDQIESFISSRLSFSIYDHCFLNEKAMRDFRIVFKYLAAGYTVSSERLFRIYEKIPTFPLPFMVIADGVDLSRFYPNNIERIQNANRPIVVGWAGNSKWGKEIDNFDYKGLRTIVKPAIASLRSEGLNIVGNFADSSMEFIPQEKMSEYYNSLDIFVCASLIEGTPNPVLEAMACGVPVVSTDVGIIPDLFGPKQKDFILAQRSVPALKEKLKILTASPDLRKELSGENLISILNWTREAECPQWDDFFSRMLLDTKPQQQIAKRACLEIPYNYGLGMTVELYLKNSWSWKITYPLRSIFWKVLDFINKLQSRFRKQSVYSERGS